MKKVLILGSGALKIGQAGEFDYSGSQCIKALKAEGISTVLINPNIATIQTSENLADRVYFVPVEPSFVEKVIEKERPEGILLGFGGQTALNTGVALKDSGVLDRYGVRVLGTPVEAIKDTEDRQRFANKLAELGLLTPRSKAVTTREDAIKAAEEFGFPVMIRIAYALGGLGSGVYRNQSDFEKALDKAFSFAQQILVEENLSGWKELEYEVVRDRFDNCISICSMENLDPMGIHTGESIVVAPIQTLTAAEHFNLRSISLKLVRALGIVGECNVQFALDPHSADYRIIEVNARLSRSSALASKATGYPLAYIAAKLSLGYALTEIENSITKETSACFEPSLDYIVMKMPRWDLQKFKHVNPVIGSEMKSVGEVMAIGRSFEEVLQKSLRMLNDDLEGLLPHGEVFDDLDDALRNPTDKRMFALATAFEQGYDIERVHSLSRIDRWFLHKIASIVAMKKQLARHEQDSIPIELLRTSKCMGFSDRQLAAILKSNEATVRKLRRKHGILPVVKQIDTMAAEYPAKTNYLYMTYNGRKNDVERPEGKQVAVLGSGAYRIGSSVEFDWCCVNAVTTLRQNGQRAIMINCNPETVSTDYDVCDTLYFEELTLERVLDICDFEQPDGVIVAMGGQTPNSLALKLAQNGVPIVGTAPERIDQAEDRHKFSSLLDRLGIDQPEWQELSTVEDAKVFAEKVGYPVLLRPSYVLSGAAMSVATDAPHLEDFLKKASLVSNEYPVVISKFYLGNKEIEVDGVAKNGELLLYAISEHVENAGVHSGDATIVFPPQKLYLETVRRIKHIARKIVAALEITGPFNIQFLAKDNHIKVIECNLRASRSFPFISKVLKINFIDYATRAMAGLPVERVDKSFFELDYVGVKAPQFSFSRLKGADPTLSVEMASTGEVGCLGQDFEEAFLLAYLAVGFVIPKKKILLSTGAALDKADVLKSISVLAARGYEFYATPGTATFLRDNGVEAISVPWPSQHEKRHVLEVLKTDGIELVINIPKSFQAEELTNGYHVRRTAVDLGIPLITNAQVAKRFLEAIAKDRELPVRHWGEFQHEL